MVGVSLITLHLTPIARVLMDLIVLFAIAENHNPR